MKHDDPYADWDAAYVLGALTPSERREYEQHLAGCAECARAVAALASAPGRPGGHRSARAGDSTTESKQAGPTTDTHADPAQGMLEPPDPDTLRSVVAETERRHHRRRIRAVLGVAVAGVLIASGALVLPSVFGSTDSQSTAYRLAEVGSTSLTGQVRLIPEPWGTRVELECLAAAGVDPDAAAAPSGAARVGSSTRQPAAADHDRFALYVVSTSGAATRIALWQASAGSRAVPIGTTDLPVARIADIEVRSVSTGDVQLRRAFG